MRPLDKPPGQYDDSRKRVTGVMGVEMRGLLTFCAFVLRVPCYLRIKKAHANSGMGLALFWLSAGLPRLSSRHQHGVFVATSHSGAIREHVNVGVVG